MTHDHPELEGKIHDLNDAISKVHDAKHAELLLGSFAGRDGPRSLKMNLCKLIWKICMAR